jgi:hypothetical protein
MVDGQFLLPNGKGDTKPVSHTSNPAPHPSRSTPAGWAVTENDDRARATRDLDRTADPQSARQVAHIARNEALLTPPITGIMGGCLRVSETQKSSESKPPSGRLPPRASTGPTNPSLSGSPGVRDRSSDASWQSLCLAADAVLVTVEPMRVRWPANRVGGPR